MTDLLIHDAIVVTVNRENQISLVEDVTYSGNIRHI